MEETALRKIILQYLGSHHTLALATVDEGGAPHAASVFYINREFKLYFLSSPTSRHGINLCRLARASATINEDSALWRSIKGIQLEGTVRRMGGLWENGLLALAFKIKFPDVAGFFSSPLELGDEIIAKVKGVEFHELSPTRLFYIDNEQGFGHREELLL